MKFLDLNGLSQLVTFGNNSYVSSVIYDSTNHVINFKNANGSVISSIDASNFIKDGMVSNVTIDTPETGPNVGKSCLIVTFNTYSGKDPIEIPIENIFSSENYYTKTEIDSQLNDKQDTLVSGTNIKTINNQSLVGSGNINITADGCEVVSNKVTSLSSSSTDTQYPSAKAVYDELSAKVSLSDYESDEEVVAESLNDLNARITSVESNKQDTISDIETIRSNAAAGAAKVSNVQSDWNATSGLSQILNKPTIPTVGEGELTIKVNGTTIETFGANQGNDDEIDISIPTESTVSNWGFTKNTGTYSKPSGGIPASDLASDVITVNLNDDNLLCGIQTTIQAIEASDGVYAVGQNNSDGTEDYVLATTNQLPTESTVSGWGFTKNAGTVTQVKVGTTEYNPTSGVVSLPAYPTSLPASDVSSWAKASSKPTYTASEVGAIATSARGAANGVAPLNASSKIDATYLPSYVDDVLEYSGISNFPSTGEAGKIYTDTSTNKIYRWSGSQYIEISPSAGVTVTNGTSALSWGTDVTVGTVNGVNITAKLPSNPDTWRGIQDNLTSSTNTTESLSAKQGYLLANGSARDDTKLPLTGGTITGTTTLTYGTNLNFIDSSEREHSLRPLASWPDSLAHYAPGNGWVRIWDSGNDGSDSGLDADLLDGKHNGELSAISCVNLGTYGVSGSTVADCKTWLAQIFSDNALGVGYNCNVGSSYINNWNDDSATYTPSSVHSFIKIGGGYSGTGYGQWLLSSYGTSRIGYVGRSGNQWTDIKWIATTEDIPTSLPASDVYSWAKASSKPSYSWSEITGKPSVAIQGEPNNFMHSTNEFTFIPPNYNNTIWFNYRTSDYTTSGNVTGYYFGDGNGHALAYIADGDMYVNSTRLAKITEIPTNTNQLTNGAGFITDITKSMVTTALGYTPPTSDTNTTYAAGTGVTISGSNNAINVTYGSSANTACQGNDSRLSNARPASDVYAWAKASTKPSYDNSEIGLTTITATGGSSLTLTGGKIYRLINLTGSFQFILDVTDVRCEDNVCASKQYHCIFSTGSTVPTINWPAIDIWYGGSAPVIEANKTYEFDIICNATDVVAICVEVA